MGGFDTVDLVKRFGKVVALDGVSLSAGRGRVHALLGPNGAGKTTLIRVLATLLKPDGGTVRVAGYDVTTAPHDVRARIALCGQKSTIDEEMSGRANLVMLGRLLGLGSLGARRRAEELLTRLDLTQAADRAATTYSGGMRRRLDVAASLVGTPQVLFLDEPTVGLDPARREEVWQVIRSMREDGVTILLTTQYLGEADVLADDVTVIDHGRVLASGTPADLKRQVGEHILTLRVQDRAQAPAAAAVLHDITGRAPTSSATRDLHAPATGEAQLYAITDRLRERRIAIEELALRLPSLDEVFIALTGKPAAEGSSEASSPRKAIS